MAAGPGGHAMTSLISWYHWQAPVPSRTPSHATLVAQARLSCPELLEPGYSRGLLSLIDAADRIGATDAIVHDVIAAYQDAAFAQLEMQG